MIRRTKRDTVHSLINNTHVATTMIAIVYSVCVVTQTRIYPTLPAHLLLVCSFCILGRAHSQDDIVLRCVDRCSSYPSTHHSGRRLMVGYQGSFITLRVPLFNFQLVQPYHTTPTYSLFVSTLRITPVYRTDIKLNIGDSSSIYNT